MPTTKVVRSIKNSNCFNIAYKFDWHPSTLKSLIVEAKIFRLGVSLICPLYVEEEWIGKKVYYRKIKYITSNTWNFEVYLQ